MRIGLLGLWAYRGAGHLNRTLYQVLTDLGHEVHVFARMGVVYGMPIQEHTGMWDVPRLRLHPNYEVSPSDLRSWAQFSKLDAVLFSEEYDMRLPMTLQQSGIRTIGYIDFLAKAQKPFLRFFDLMLTSTHRTEAVLQEWNKGEQTHYIGWGVEPQMFDDPTRVINLGYQGLFLHPSTKRHDFFTNAGWLGINIRKGLDTILEAMDLCANVNDPPTCYVHCQLRQADALKVMNRSIGLPPYVIWDERTIQPPGLYTLGRVVVQPSKLEGLGLTIVEAMAAGRPTIVPDAAPMNEMVTQETGWLVPVSQYVNRGDGIVFPEAHIDPSALAKTIQEARAASDQFVEEKARLTLVRAQDLFNWEQFKGRIAVGLERIGLG